MNISVSNNTNANNSSNLNNFINKMFPAGILRKESDKDKNPQ